KHGEGIHFVENVAMTKLEKLDYNSIREFIGEFEALLKVSKNIQIQRYLTPAIRDAIETRGYQLSDTKSILKHLKKERRKMKEALKESAVLRLQQDLKWPANMDNAHATICAFFGSVRTILKDLNYKKANKNVKRRIAQIVQSKLPESM